MCGHGSSHGGWFWKPPNLSLPSPFTTELLVWWALNFLNSSAEPTEQKCSQNCELWGDILGKAERKKSGRNVKGPKTNALQQITQSLLLPPSCLAICEALAFSSQVFSNSSMGYTPAYHTGAHETFSNFPQTREPKPKLFTTVLSLQELPTCPVPLVCTSSFRTAGSLASPWTGTCHSGTGARSTMDPSKSIFYKVC